MRRILAVLFVVGAVAMIRVAGYAGEEPAPPAFVVSGPEEYAENVVRVEIRNFMFSPGEITVPPGTTVVWRQSDNAGHNVHLFADKAMNKLPQDIVGRLLSPGQSFAVTFSEEGTYEYQCDPHPFMVGTVIVRAAE